MAKKKNLTKAKAKEMLHNPPHGKPLTEKQRKFFGAIASAMNGIEATMGGLTDKGFNYNGAWGGQFQMGGNVLPGAVGFTYARTQGAAPSNGPYAKKTKASAQNGMEMKYYQEGLDFSPKTISQNGTKIPLLPIDRKAVSENTRVVVPQRDMRTADEVKAAAERARFFEALANQPVIKSSNTPIDIEERNRRNKAYAQKYGRTYDEATGTVGPAFSPSAEKTMNKAMENIVEPGMVLFDIGGATSVLKSLPVVKNIGAIGKNFIEQTAKEIDRKYIYPLQYKKQISELQNIHSGAAQRYGSGEGAKRLSAVLGIDPLKMEQPLLTSIPGEGSYYNSLFNQINIDLRQAKRLRNEHLLSPKSIYEHEYGHFFQREADRFSDEYANKLKKYEKELAEYNSPENQKILSAPVDVNDPNSWIYNRSLVKLNPGFKPQPLAKPTKIDLYANKVYDVDPVIKDVGANPYGGDALDNSMYFIHDNTEQLAHLREMRQNMIDKGYIKSDYDPISAETIAKFVKENRKDRISSFTDVNNPKVIAGLEKVFRNLPAAVPPAIGASVAASNFEQKKNGGDIPVDSEGYWNPDNWGNPVIIPSTDITMEGVHQPLIGISDTGDIQYMEPGEDYEFDGEYVTEYPVAQKGKKLPSIQTSDPADPRLHSYLDSVNLNKAYLAQQKFNPPKNIREHYFQRFGKNMSSNRFEKLISLEESDKKAYKYLKESKRRETFNPKSNNDYFESEKELKEYSPQDASLINAYKSLTFSSPTETGLWTTPDLYNKLIAPTDVYFGGKEHVAFNPVYSAPVQKIEYTGNPKDYMKYRSGPTIRGTKYKFNPKSKLTPKSSKPSTVEPKKENLVVSTPSVPIPPAEPKYKMRGDSPIYGPSGSLIGMIDRKTKEFYPDYLNEAARAKVNKTDTDILSDSSALSNYFKSIGQNDVRIVPKKKSGGSINKADEAPIEKLDQLLNFTNYNKATKGGWLDKYQ